MKSPCLPPSSETSLDELLELRRQLDVWRQSQGPRPRLPDELWDLAASLARIHGISRVARTLRISFQKLRGRLQPPAPSGFVELPPMGISGPAGRACVVELDDGRGARMTVRVEGQEPLIALAEAFWRRAR